jgi:hypothetical protein
LKISLFSRHFFLYNYRMTKAKDTKKHNWGKAQPHQGSTGKITSRGYARNNPRKVTWVTAKTASKRKKK